MSPWSSHNVLLASLTLFPHQFLILCPFLEKKNLLLSSTDLENHIYTLGVLSQNLTLSVVFQDIFLKRKILPMR